MSSTAHSVSETPILTVAAVISDGHGRVLLVRKQATDTFIQPGGKREPGEAPLATLARELREELDVELVESSAIALGEFEAVAIHEAGRRVRAIAYSVQVCGVPRASAEIAELIWVDPVNPGCPVAPLSTDFILPAWQAMRVRMQDPDARRGASAV